jgi:hypothetical protein
MIYLILSMVAATIVFGAGVWLLVNTLNEEDDKQP